MKRLLLLTLLFSLQISLAADLSVQPLYLEFKNMGKEEENFEIKVSSTAAAIVNVTLYEAKQDLSGKLSFIESNNKEIIELKKNRYSFKRKGVEAITGKIIYPKKLNKTIVYALMIEEEKNEAIKGIGINVRYAVVFKINTNKRRIYEKGTFSKLNIKKAGQRIVIQGLFENTTVKDYKVISTAYVRDNRNKLIERIPLKTASSWKKDVDESIVFPNSKVHLVGPLSKISKAGTYRITVINKINNKRQIIKKETIKISKDILKQVAKNDVKAGEIVVRPGPIEITLKNKRQAHYRIEITNPSNENIEVVLPMLSINGSKEKSYTFFPSTLRIMPGKKKYAVLKLNNSVDKKWQIKNVELQVRNESKKIINNFSLPVRIKYE
jgi:hypothetical protein